LSHIHQNTVMSDEHTVSSIDVRELIFSGHTIKVTVYTNVQLIFPLF